MKESSLILDGFAALCGEGRGGALATVVHVAGSSYRRSGARMLVAADGRTWGGVSGGCLEHDVARRLRNLIGTNETAVVRYDTRDESDEYGAGGVALGCEGVIDLFLEPVSSDRPGPVHALRRAVVDRRSVALATVIRSAASTMPSSTRVLFESPESSSGSIFSEDLSQLFTSGAGGVRRCDLPSGGSADVFFELLRPPQSLVLFGGGSDVVPVVAIVKQLGWHVTVVAPASSTGARERFAAADQVMVTDGDDPPPAIEGGAAVVLMTHNYPRDLRVLPSLLSRSPRYLGILGPKRRTERLLAECRVSLEAAAGVYGPVGLDLGADAPETIALAIVAEIQAVLANRPTQSLRDKPGPIYDRAGGADAPQPAGYVPTACPISA